MLCISSELINLELGNMLTAVGFVILGIVDDRATIATLGYNNVENVTARFTA